MTGKDPKDMTASELLRWAAKEYMVGHSHCEMTLNGAFCHGLRDCYLRDTALIALADKIDAELEGSLAKNCRMAMETIAKYKGWPEFRDGEGVIEWLERCWLPRPRFEDGEVVGVREYEDINGYCVYDDGEFFVATPNRSIGYAAGERVERPAPEVLGADGKPIVKDETVYPIDGDWIGDPLEVASIDRDGSVRVSLPDGKGWTCYLADFLTHTPPDTQQRIDEDARKSTSDYWGCRDAGCGCCPAKIDGKIPRDWFDTRSCMHAQLLDLLRRQRRLDEVSK